MMMFTKNPTSWWFQHVLFSPLLGEDFSPNLTCRYFFDDMGTSVETDQLVLVLCQRYSQCYEIIFLSTGSVG